MTENNLLPEQAPSMFGQPLAARMRPSSLDEIAGQQHLLAPASSTCWAKARSSAG